MASDTSRPVRHRGVLGGRPKKAHANIIFLNLRHFLAQVFTQELHQEVDVRMSTEGVRESVLSIFMPCACLRWGAQQSLYRTAVPRFVGRCLFCATAIPHDYATWRGKRAKVQLAEECTFPSCADWSKPPLEGGLEHFR